MHWGIFITRFSLRVVLLCTALLYGCSTKKNTFVNRTYHNVTAHYNGYFNAGEIVKEGKKTLAEQHVEDFSKVLPIFIYGNEVTSKSIYPEMDKAIEKCSRVIQRHSMKIGKKEHCKWIDDNYLLIGVAHFYKKEHEEAEKLFSFVAKGYKGEDSKFPAILWLARNYIEIEKYNKAKTTLALLDEENNLPKELIAEKTMVEADLMLRQGNMPLATERLEAAIPLVRNKKKKARLTFILAQVYQLRGDSRSAIKNYAKVVRLNPPYEMAFYAKINQALAYDASQSAEAIKVQLLKMLKDEKNIEYYDQIYYALADLSLKERKKKQGIEYLITSTQVSTSNKKQKGKSFLRLADLFFEDRVYPRAQLYYDSAKTFLPEDYPNYNEVKSKSESLTELIEDLRVIHREDSLQEVAQLSEEERDKLIQKLIDQAIKEEERKKLEEELKQQQALANNQQSSGKGNKQNAAKWYFYNPQTIGYGLGEFRRIWGERALADNWRRKDKSSTIPDFTDNTNATDSSGSATVAVKDNQTKAFYLKDIPLTDEAIQASHDMIVEALYSSGRIYKDKLNDIENAIESFEDLISRYDSCKYTVVSYYQLYRLYLDKENSGASFFSFSEQSSSTYYKDILLSEYPESEYSLIINNPEHVKEEEKIKLQEQEEYWKIYELYRKRRYNQVLLSCNRIIQGNPDHFLIAKVYFLKALVVGEKTNYENLKKSLLEIVEKFPDTPESAEAKNMLVSIENAKKNTESTSSQEQAQQKPLFDTEIDRDHFFVYIFPSKEINANQMKAKISDFNLSHFSTLGLKISSSVLDSDQQMIILRTFKNKEKAMDYYIAFKNDEKTFKDIDKEKVKSFAITQKNFSILFKDKEIDKYLSFFQETYLK